MLRRSFAIMLSGLILLTAFGYQGAGAQSLGDQQTEKIRTRVHKMGVGVNARVEIKLKDKSQFKGYISDANEDSLTVVQSGTGSSRTTSYSEISSVKKAGSGVSAKTLIILGAAAAGAAVTWVILKPVLCDGGAQSRGPC
jgi:hypothetical protein